MTAALEGGGWVVRSTPRPYFAPAKEPVPILQEAGWAPGPVWTGGKSRPHRNSIPDRPARTYSLYRLSYPAHNIMLYYIILYYISYGTTVVYTVRRWWKRRYAAHICICTERPGLLSPVGWYFTTACPSPHLSSLVTCCIHLLSQPLMCANYLISFVVKERSILRFSSKDSSPLLRICIAFVPVSVTAKQQGGYC